MLIGSKLNVIIKMLGVKVKKDAEVKRDRRRKGYVKIDVVDYNVSKPVPAAIIASCIRDERPYIWKK